ncbi:MAG: Ig-like domain-containing protein [Paludibacteraceae bacterium]|nr:Ig-like domain-containing protein [Paludibacteraceae bacterium]
MKKFFSLFLAVTLCSMSAMADDFYLCGSWWNNWAADDEVKFVDNSVTIHLDAFTLYQFKFYNSTADAWSGVTDGATMVYGDCTNWWMNEGSNCRFLSADAGDYTFTLGWNNVTPVITATYPTPAVTPVTLTNGGNKVTYYASHIDNDYTLVVTSAKNLDGMGGAFWTTSNGNERIDAHLQTLNAKAFKIEVTSTTAPQMYTPFYVLNPGEVNYGQFTIDWVALVDPRAVSDLAITSGANVNIDLASATTSQITYTTSSTGAVTYETSKSSVATVSAEGLITAVGVGSATITINQAEDANYRKGKQTITVLVSNSNTVPTHLYGTLTGVATNAWSGRDDPETHQGIFNDFPYSIYYDVIRNNDQTISAKAFLSVEPASDGSQLESTNGFVFQFVDYNGGTNYNNFIKNGEGVYEATTVATFTDGDPAHFMFRMAYNAGGSTPEIWPTVAAEANTYVLNSRVVNDWYTICLPFDATITGATLYSVGSENAGTLSLNEVGTTAEAGKAYLYKATATTVNVTYTAVAAHTADTYLVGNLSATPVDLIAADDAYILGGDNKFHHIEGTATATVGQYKAYLKLPVPSAAPVLRIVESSDVATSVEEIAGENVAVKFIENGKVFIVREGVVYDVLGNVIR